MMTLPDPVLRQVREALESALGKATDVESVSTIGGGCINSGTRLQTDGGQSFFLKWNPSSSPDMFEAEADGLRGLAAPRALRIPEVLGWGGRGTPTEPAWILMEFIPRGQPGPEYGIRLGEGLARLHDAGSAPPDGADGEAFGWHRPNYIGSLPQANHPDPSWSRFWRDRRLAPQLAAARGRGYLAGADGRILDRLLEEMDQVMEGADRLGPALIHGDLWSGNFYPDSDGEPVLIDPATYRGVGEVDLAMMELFGNLPGGFRESYAHHRGWTEEYELFRRDLYQLYFLLVHVNLFGGGYVGGTLAAARRALAGS
jgi:fructosamine-3-kinase